MPEIQVTPEAAVELRRRIDASGLPHTVVIVVRLNKGADLRRGSNGEAVWSIERPAISWSCKVLAIPENESLSEFDVEGIRFALAKNELASIKRIEVVLLNGEPQANVDA